MGEHSKEPISWGGAMHRDENDRWTGGYHGFGFRRRGNSKAEAIKIFTGPERATYNEAVADCNAEREKIEREENDFSCSFPRCTCIDICRATGKEIS